MANLRCVLYWTKASLELAGIEVSRRTARGLVTLRVF